MSISADAAGVCLVSEVTAADTRAIQDGLNELWRLAGSGEVGGALVRAASLTLIVLIEDHADPDELIPVLDALTATYPCRAVLLTSDKDVDEPRARLASHSRRGVEGEPPRYWEEIRIVAPARGLHQVMSSVATLALPNLPVQSWWPGRPSFDSDLYNHVVEVSDRVIVDSSRFPAPLEALPELDAAISVAHESVAFADLSWTRLTPWRHMAAEFFDAPSRQALLDSIERVRIEYMPRTGGEACQALLVAGWLASRLGWELRDLALKAAGSWRLQALDVVRPIEVAITRAATSASPGGTSIAPGLRGLSIEAGGTSHKASFTIECSSDGGEAHTVAEVGEARLEGYARLPLQGDAELLQEELGGFATDHIYQESLGAVARLLRESAGPGPGRGLE